MSCSRRSSDTKQSIFTNKDSHGWKCVRLSQMRFPSVSPGVKLSSLALPPQGSAWPANMWFMKSIFIIITLCPSKIWLGRYKLKFIHTFCLPCPIVTVVLLVMAEKVDYLDDFGNVRFKTWRRGQKGSWVYETYKILKLVRSEYNHFQR